MSIVADLKYTIRSFRRAPALTAALLLTLAIGIGSNAVVLGFIRGLVGSELPLPGIDTLVSVFSRDASDGFGPMSLDDVHALKGHADVFAVVGAVRESQAAVSASGRPSVVPIATATPEVFDLLGMPRPDGIIVSDRFWRVEMDGRSDAVGQSIRVDGVDRRVAEVAPAWLDGLYFGRTVDLWVPLENTAVTSPDGRSRSLWVLARLRSRVTASTAQLAVNVGRTRDAMIAVQPYTGTTPEVAGGLFRLSGLLPAAAGVVFFIACANVIAFLLARASARSQETSVRVAIGASRAQLGRQVVSESVLVAVAGGAVGLLLAAWTTDVIPALLFEQDAEELTFTPDVAAVAVVSAVCVAVTIVCGLAPFFEVRHDDPAAVLRRESGGPSNAARRLRSGLVIAQMSCCGILVIATGVLLNGFHSALRTGAGDQLGEPIVATVEASSGRDYFRRAQQAALAIDGIDTAVWTSIIPGGRSWWQTYRIEPADVATRDAMARAVATTPAVIASLKLPPIAGRMFGGRDTADSGRVAVVNEQAAAETFAGDAVGRAIAEPAGGGVEIIGVVRPRPTLGNSQPPGPTIYYYPEQGPPPVPSGALMRISVPATPLTAAGILAPTVVSAGYFQAMGFSLVAGTLFGEGPVPGTASAVAVVNQQAAELYFKDGAVGATVIDVGGARTKIVGVVRSSLLRTSQRESPPAIFVPAWHAFEPRMTLILGARRADAGLVETVDRALRGVDGGRLWAVRTLDAHLSWTALAPTRIATLLVGVAAIFALVLAALGLYGALAESARQRRREIALRLALGAQSWRVIRQVVTEGLRLAAVGAVGGAVGSLLVMRWLWRLAPGAGAPSVTDWLVLPAVLAGAVLIASAVPARRALAVSPLTIMRDS